MLNQLKVFDEKLKNYKIYQTLTQIPRRIRWTLTRLRKYGMGYPFRLIYAKVRMLKQSEMPLVSVVMPVYNVEDFLEQSLDSLLQQKVKNIEIVAVDDGSTDTSLEILQKYAAKDSRVKVFSQKNQYAGNARNLGLSKASGEYVLFLDSDDFFEKELILDTYSVAKANAADIVLFDAGNYDNETGEYKGAGSFLEEHLSPSKQPFSYKECTGYLFQMTTACPWTKLYKRAFLIESGIRFQGLKNTNDLFFVYSTLAVAKRILTYKKPLVNYRIGMSKNLQATKKKDPFCFYEALLEWNGKLKELGLFEKLKQSYVNAALDVCVYNLWSIQDEETKWEVFQKIRNEIFDKLEITGYPEMYYYNREDYNDMLLIKNGDFERYLNEQSR